MSSSENIEHVGVVKIRKDNILRFACITVVVLLLSIGSLTTISGRQATVLDAESELQQLQNRITATVFLQLDSSNGAVTDQAEVKTTGLESKLIDPKTISTSYLKLNDLISTTKAEISDGLPFTLDSGGFITHMPFRYISTEALLGLLLISCGVLGSIMSALREQGGAVSKPVVLGASVGFVALLGVKSGSTLFILTSAGADVPYNAYSTALAGVIAGMFSEKLYIALSSLTDRAFGQNS
ncbi:hypothetical protein P0I90_004672 [Vibrio parahaemolyticus]|nr:hypothetical protein [Vibrio parahaemolyticus]EKO5210620.1 hypothetical protein [Vibrio parahaemolyticus]ELA7289375.1 hypothetical protein [Vibrio parahaemolyticus]MBE4250002.1 hypothetical protein [Vibrio parahaemolyticus]MDF5636715.1 hypothetical protein [Vibrio parahaemolyticus]